MTPKSIPWHAKQLYIYIFAIAVNGLDLELVASIVVSERFHLPQRIAGGVVLVLRVPLTPTRVHHFMAAHRFALEPFHPFRPCLPLLLFLAVIKVTISTQRNLILI